MKIFCIGRNYVDHAKELNNPVPKSPLVFMKPPTALLKDPNVFYIPDFSQDVHYEIEVILKMKKNGKSIQPAFALDYIDTVTVGIDFTARDVQSKLKEKGHPWEIAKGFDGSALVGSWKEYEREKPIHFVLEKNGETVQKGDSTELIFNFARLICHVSTYFTIQKGDLIYTGTPAGVGKVNAGDQLVGYIESEQAFNCQIK
jgi:2-keto-4-pentenoate hydratase/2-oxohepta-3-ene-1,7-dioic acid hydratase in catechol pathway